IPVTREFIENYKTVILNTEENALKKREIPDIGDIQNSVGALEEKFFYKLGQVDQENILFALPLEVKDTATPAEKELGRRARIALTNSYLKEPRNTKAAVDAFRERFKGVAGMGMQSIGSRNLVARNIAIIRLFMKNWKENKYPTLKAVANIFDVTETQIGLLFGKRKDLPEELGDKVIKEFTKLREETAGKRKQIVPVMEGILIAAMNEMRGGVDVLDPDKIPERDMPNELRERIRNITPGMVAEVMKKLGISAPVSANSFGHAKNSLINTFGDEKLLKKLGEAKKLLEMQKTPEVVAEGKQQRLRGLRALESDQLLGFIKGGKGFAGLDKTIQGNILYTLSLENYWKELGEEEVTKEAGVKARVFLIRSYLREPAATGEILKTNMGKFRSHYRNEAPLIDAGLESVRDYVIWLMNRMGLDNKSIIKLLGIGNPIIATALKKEKTPEAEALLNNVVEAHEKRKNEESKGAVETVKKILIGVKKNKRAKDFVRRGTIKIRLDAGSLEWVIARATLNKIRAKKKDLETIGYGELQKIIYGIPSSRSRNIKAKITLLALEEQELKETLKKLGTRKEAPPLNESIAYSKALDKTLEILEKETGENAALPPDETKKEKPIEKTGKAPLLYSVGETGKSGDPFDDYASISSPRGSFISLGITIKKELNGVGVSLKKLFSKADR
ncbi:MAG: hypothetical protein KAJ10_09740, partial [Thermodesulfovibrionia bacterium]|nr:hypothetical protein [Thermodesulfovibrionia bacterium]